MYQCFLQDLLNLRQVKDDSTYKMVVALSLGSLLGRAEKTIQVIKQSHSQFDQFLNQVPFLNNILLPYYQIARRINLNLNIFLLNQ